MSNLRRLGVAIIASYAAGLIGTLFSGMFGAWYASLNKPPLTPAASVFPVVWIILYALMGIAAGIVWNKKAPWHAWVGCFFVSLAFNASWTIFFFGFHALFLAFIDIICLDFMVIALYIGAKEIDRFAMWLLLPYLLWILFATYLNLGIWYLN